MGDGLVGIVGEFQGGRLVWFSCAVATGEERSDMFGNCVGLDEKQEVWDVVHFDDRGIRLLRGKSGTAIGQRRLGLGVRRLGRLPLRQILCHPREHVVHAVRDRING